MDLILEEFKEELKYKKITKGEYDNNGDYVKGKEEEYIFLGAILPLSEKDTKYLPDGAYGIDDMKLYTNEDLKDNTIIETIEGEKYKIYAHRKYRKISMLKRYFMKRVDEIND